jgi:hypothetical protein
LPPFSPPIATAGALAGALPPLAGDVIPEVRSPIDSAACRTVALRPVDYFGIDRPLLPVAAISSPSHRSRRRVPDRLTGLPKRPWLKFRPWKGQGQDELMRSGGTFRGFRWGA